MEKYQKVLSRSSMGGVQDIVKQSKAMLHATLIGDEEQVAAILEAAHDREIPFLQYNDENSLSCVITLCYLYARKDYMIQREAKSGKGYCDYLFIPKKADDPAQKSRCSPRTNPIWKYPMNAGSQTASTFTITLKNGIP